MFLNEEESGYWLTDTIAIIYVFERTASKAKRLRRIEFKLSCFVITYLWKSKSAFEN